MKNIKELFDLKGKVALVTGGAGHLGYFISEALLEAGASVYIASRNVRRCIEKAEKLNKKTGSKAKGLFLDISNEEIIKEALDVITKEEGKLDILINNASYGACGDLETMSEAEWAKGIDGTINGVFRITKAVIPLLEKAESPAIINLASMYGLVSPNKVVYKDTKFNNPPNYGAGKAAVIQFTRYCACYLAEKNIRVNSISPGPFPNKEVQKNKEFINNLENKVPLKRIGKPYELKGGIVFLASDASSYVTGENISIDGGWTAW